MINELKVGNVYEVTCDLPYTECDGLEEFENEYFEDGFTKSSGNYVIPKGTKMVYVGEIGTRNMDMFVIGRGQYEFSYVEYEFIHDITR